MRYFFYSQKACHSNGKYFPHWRKLVSAMQFAFPHLRKHRTATGSASIIRGSIARRREVLPTLAEASHGDGKCFRHSRKHRSATGSTSYIGGSIARRQEVLPTFAEASYGNGKCFQHSRKPNTSIKFSQVPCSYQIFECF